MPENKKKDDNDGLLEGRRIVYHRFLGYEYKSKTTLWGLPLLHIHFGFEFCRAKGIIAIGNVATGWIAPGGIASAYLPWAACPSGYTRSEA